jgi:hypothetical protein
MIFRRGLLAACALSLLMMVSSDSILGFATCTGSAPCYACKNCKYCRHCAKEGGTCGVCKR